MLRVRFVFPLLLAVAAIAAGCGGGGGGRFVGVPTVPPGPTPFPIPTSTAQVITLTGGGYTLTFTLPQIINGSEGTMSANLVTALPVGIPAPQSRSSAASSRVPAATTFQPLIYLAVSASANVEFATAPIFHFIVPSGAIPNGQSTYLLYYDPKAAAWVNLLGPGVLASNTLTFPVKATDIPLAANATYYYALVVTASPQPTAPPTPVPTPSSTPIPVPTSSPVVVTLNAPPFSVTFTMPTPATGGQGTIAASLSTTLPAGTNQPQGRRSIIVKPLAAAYTGMVYLSITPSTPLGLSSTPSFQFSSTTNAIGSATHLNLLFWDPASGPLNGWKNLLSPSSVNGNTVTFPGIQSGTQFDGVSQYIYALASSAQVQPTATPAPTPSPTPVVSPTPGSAPAYCAGAAPASPNPAIAPATFQPQPILFKNLSNVNADIVLYATDTGSSSQFTWLGLNGAPANVTSGASAPPIPLACFPGSIVNPSTGQPGQGIQFKIPLAVSGRLYVALAPHMDPSSTTAPNPLNLVGTGATGIQVPTFDATSPAFAGTPFDVLEYSNTSATYATVDITEENAIGLPLELSMGALTTVSGQPSQSAFTLGFPINAEQTVINDLKGQPPYDTLPTYTAWPGTSGILLRVMAPQGSGIYGFPQDWWYNPVNYTGGTAYYPSKYTAANQGYIGYILKSLNTTPELFTIANAGGTEDNYCLTSNGYSTLTFNEVGTATSCPASTIANGNVITQYAYNTLEGSPLGTTDSVNGYCKTAIFAMDPGGTGPVLTSQSAFYLWKALVTDIARGVLLRPNVTHPFAGWLTPPSFAAPSPPFSSYTPQDPVQDLWWYSLHNRMDSNKAYAIPYDEPGFLAPTFSPSLTGQPLSMTLQAIPRAPAGAALIPADGFYNKGTNSAPLPWPTPPALPCPAAPIPTPTP